MRRLRRQPRTCTRVQTVISPETFVCPGCGTANVPPGRVFCRPSCRARYEHRERQREPRLFPAVLSLESEL
jgi:predicted nucleic acid-binding Zn ribbon protein